MENEKDYINKMYDASLDSQKAQLQQGQAQAEEELAEQQRKAQQQTDANLTRTYVEAEKARKNYAEVQNAYGLTSGAMAQARLAQENQRTANMTALRQQQQEVDAAIEQERGRLGREYTAAIQQAQANNDLARAQALYEAAQREEERLLAKQEAAAKLMAGEGDYRRLAELYGLTEEELLRLMGQGGGYVPATSTGTTSGNGYSPGRNYTEEAFGE